MKYQLPPSWPPGQPQDPSGWGMETRPPIIKPWQRLWVKFALFAAMGVLSTHFIYVTLATRASGRALEEQMLRQGRVLLQELASREALQQSFPRHDEIGYLLLIRNGLPQRYSSLGEEEVRALLPQLSMTPQRVQLGDAEYLNLATLLPDRSGRVLHLGLRTRAADKVRREMSLMMGVVASLLVLAGVLAAFAVGGWVARPVGHLVATLRRMDPSQEPVPLPEEGQDEIGFLVHRFNEMRHRLFMVHNEEEQIRRERLRMEKLAALGTLIAGVAHEINNPLTGLKNCVQRLGREGLAAERRAEYLELMRDALNRIQKVVAQLLHYSRTVTSNRRTVRIAEIINSTEQFLMSTVLRSAHKNLEKDLGDADNVWVSVDAPQIEQALTNLILNALYVTPSNGTVRLRLRTEEGRVGFQVTDQGPGIPEEIRSQIEDPFFSTKPEGEGTGMGLYVTRNIVEAHKGDLIFEFPDEGGTAVTVWLPVAEPPLEEGTRPGRDRVNPTMELPRLGGGEDEPDEPDEASAEAEPTLQSEPPAEPAADEGTAEKLGNQEP